jgi:hypothetical protein
VLYEHGRDVRGDRSNIPGYPYERALKNAANVRGWIEGQFKVVYPGFDVEVLNASGRRVHGRTKVGDRTRYLPGRLTPPRHTQLAVEERERR